MEKYKKGNSIPKVGERFYRDKTGNFVRFHRNFIPNIKTKEQRQIRTSEFVIPEVKTFVEDPTKKFSSKFLSNEAYSEAIEAFIIVCGDTMITDEEGTVYLARRKAKPAKGLLWYIGGRLRRGLDANVAMSMNFKRETGLVIPPERFKFVAMYRYLLSDREQEPQDAGTDSLAYQFILQLTKEEISKIKLDANEYAAPELIKVNPKKPSEDLHPSVISTCNIADKLK